MLPATGLQLSRRMLALGFLAQNLAIGLTGGVFGAFVIPFSESFGVSRGVAASSNAILVLMFLGSSPWVGSLLHRHEIRNVMSAGAALMAAGFGLLAIAQSVPVVLLLCAVLGLGCALLGPLPAMALVTNWFDEGRGRATGIVLIPLGVVIMPVVATFMIETLGWRATFACFALLVLVAAPVLRLVRDHPPDRIAPPFEKQEAASTKGGSVNRQRLKDPDFWVIAIAAALIISANVSFATHIIAYARGLGIDAAPASLLLATWGATGMLGSYVFGWMCDRFGAAAALAANAAAQMALWLMLWQGGSFEFLLAAAALIGICGGGSVTALSTLLSVRYGAEQFSQTMGLAMLIQLPINFAAPVLTGFLFDATGAYGPAFLAHMTLFAIAAAVFARYAGKGVRLAIG